MRFRLLPILLCASLCYGQLAPALDQFRSEYHASLKKNGIVGSGCAFVHGSEVVAQDFYGDAVRGLSRVDENTAFHWASITKTFTGIAIMQLRDHGLLQLDDPIVKYVPELKAVHDRYGPVEAITIRQLMTHSAGFRSPTWPWNAENRGDEVEWAPFEPTKWSQIVAMLPYTDILFPPGSKHSYSNLGIVFLGQVIERLSGDDYEVYVDKNILRPLEMRQSYFDRSPYFLLSHRAAGYLGNGRELKPAPFNFDSGITVSNGGLNAPIADMAKYLRFLIGERGNERYEQVLKRSSLEEMWRKQLPLTSTDPSQGSPQSGHDWIGLNFFLHEENGRMYVGHGGQQAGFVSHIWVDPASRSAYVIAFNTDIEDGGDKTQALDRDLGVIVMRTIFPAMSAKL